jgi:membrane protein YqaA with SNARE-associated domain
MLELYHYGYLGLFLACFLAATILPLSSEGVLSLMIYGGYDIYISLAVATIGNTLGGMSSYYLGYLGRWKWIEKYLRIKREKLERLHSRLGYKGGVLAALTWVPFVGDVLAVLLGVLRINPWSVLVFMFIGKLARYIVWGYLTVWIVR